MADENSSGSNPEQPQEGRTFTQEEVNAIMAKEKGQGERSVLKMFGLKDKDEAQEFAQKIKLWQESQQSEADKIKALQSEKEGIETSYKQAVSELNGLKAEKYLLSQGVSSADTEFVAFKVGKLINEDTDFEKAVEAFKKENPRFFVKEQDGVRVDFGASHQGTPPSGASGTMNSILRKAKRG